MTSLTETTVEKLLREATEKYPESKAVEYSNLEYSRTWEELDRESDKVAKGFLGLGMKKGDHVAIWATNRPEWLLTFLAASKIGAVLVPFNTSYRENEIRYLLEQSDSRYLVISEGFKDLKYREIVRGLDKRYQYLEKIIYFGEGEESEFYPYRKLFSLGERVSDKIFQEAKRKVKSSDILTILYTSGTTNFPKGVMLTHSSIINNAKGIAEALKFTEKDRLCIPTPFFHCFGLSASIMACMTKGTVMIPVDYYRPLEVLEAVQKYKCTALHGVPAMFIALLNHPRLDEFDIESLRTGIVAGDGCGKENIKKIISKLGITELLTSYGQTECSPAATISSIEDGIEKRAVTVGREMPHVEIKITDPKTGKRVGRGQIGELCTRGYHVMQGYYKKPLETKKAIDEEGWLHTGDLASIDGDGYYRIHGRIKDIIIRGGENISPAEIENVILEDFKEISDCQVVGISDNRLGEEVAACIICKEGIEIENIRTKIGERLAKYKIPKYFEIFKQFPITASGKVEKYKLRYELEKKYNGEEKNG